MMMMLVMIMVRLLVAIVVESISVWHMRATQKFLSVGAKCTGLLDGWGKGRIADFEACVGSKVSVAQNS